MDKYVITKSMNRTDCSNLMLKLRLEIFGNNILDRLDKQLTKRFTEKKKSRLLGNKKNGDKIFVVADYIYKGIKLIILKPEKIGFIIIYNISPIDAPFVQFMWVDEANRPTIITQHLLDRYNERILNITNASYKDLIIHFTLNSNDRYGNQLAYDSDTNETIQRIDGGFIFGVEHKDYTVFNTVYESIEGKDNDIKKLARSVKVNWDDLTSSQKAAYIKLQNNVLAGIITEEEFHKLLINS
jgi:hypothetical protein